MHRFARALVLAGLAGIAFLATASRAFALETPTIEVTLHRADHSPIANPQVGLLTHPRIAVFGSSKTTTATGSVSVQMYIEGACQEPQGGPASGDLVNGIFDATVLAYLPPTIHQICFRVTYSGDANFAGTSASRTFTVQRGSISMTSAIHRSGTHQVVSTVPVGTSVHGWVQLSWGGYAPTGRLSIKRFSDGSCTNLLLELSISPVPTSGTQDDALVWRTDTVGSISYSFAVTADTRYEAVPPVCHSLTVTKAKPAFSENVLVGLDDLVVAEASTVDATTGVHQRVAMNGGAGPVVGTVLFQAFLGSTCGGGAVGGGTFDLVNGSAAGLNWVMYEPGPVSFRATYQGNATYQSLVSDCLDVKYRLPVGSVDLETHPAGSHTAAGAFDAGDSIHAKVTVTVDGVAPTGGFTGRVYGNGTCAGSPLQSLSATGGAVKDPAFTWTAGPVGGYSVQAEFKGDSTYLARLGNCRSYTVERPDPDVDMAFRNAVGDPITATTLGTTVFYGAHVHGDWGIATGRIDISFFSNGTCAGQATSVPYQLGPDGRTATTAVVPRSAGAISVQGVYRGDAAYAPVVSPCAALQVGRGRATITAEPHDASHETVTGVPSGSTVHLAVAVSGVGGPGTGSVTVNVYASADCSGSPFQATDAGLVAGAADVVASGVTLAVGDYSLEAIYDGDTNYIASRGPCNTVVGLAPGDTPPPPTPTPSPGPSFAAPSPPATSFEPTATGPVAPSIDPESSVEPGATLAPGATLDPGASIALPAPASSDGVATAASSATTPAASSSDALAGATAPAAGIPPLALLALALLVLGGLVAGFMATRRRKRTSRESQPAAEG